MDDFYIKHQRDFSTTIKGEDGQVRYFPFRMLLDNNDLYYIMPVKKKGQTFGKYYKAEDLIKAGLYNEGLPGGDVNSMNAVTNIHALLCEEYQAPDLFCQDRLEYMAESALSFFRTEFLEQRAPKGETMPKFMQVQTLDDFKDQDKYSALFAPAEDPTGGQK